MMPSYGKFIVRQILNKKQSLLQSYSFEQWNIVDYEGLEFFAGWNIVQTYGTGITYGHEEVDRDDSKGAMYVRFSTLVIDGVEVLGGGYKEALIYSLYNSCEFKAGDLVKISFDYLIYMHSLPYAWMLIEYKIKIGSYYLNGNGNWDTSDPGYLELYTSSYNGFQTHELIVRSPGITGTPVDGDIEFYIKVNNGGYADTDESTYGRTYLKAIDVSTNDVGLKRIIYDDTIRGYYELVLGDDAESIPDVIRPDNFATTTNEVVWKLQASNNGLSSIGSILLDNVVVRYLPDGEETPEFQESIVTTNPNNPRTLEVEILQGDCPENITNAKNAYDSFLTNAIGFLTDSWTRDGISEADFLQRILLRSLISQGQRSCRRLQGRFISDLYMQPYSCVVETMDSNRLYQTQGLEIEFKEVTHTLDLYELRDVEAAGGVVTPFSNAFASSEFGASFD
jgi:hypothetical protein